ncbi:MAG: TRAP transporter large permease subunit [Bradyrhizobium sp.]|nr:TRAP transporter large permease subunit [Bradyrhizobium sp.]
MNSVDMSLTASTKHGVVDGLERALTRLIEIPAIVALVAEVGILFTGVMSRFVFNRPLTWADELASITFLWLAMFGAVLALSRGEHMRMTALVDRVSPRVRAVLECLALMAPALFLGILLHPAIDYANGQSFVETPALGLSDSLRAGAVPVGIGLMLATALLRMTRHASRDLAIALVLLATVALVLWGTAPALKALGNWNLIVFFALLLGAAVLAGVPIAFCFGLATIAYLLTVTTAPLEVVTSRIDEGVSSLVLLAIPLFILLGHLIVMTRMAEAMVGFLVSLVGHVRGGLSYVLLGAILLVSGISGAKTADMAAVAPVLFPEMVKRGARPGDLVALLSATGAQTETIPPSLVLITIGSVTGVSIAALFTGGLLPGLVLAAMLCIVVWQRYRGEDLSHVSKASLTVIAKSFVIALPAVALPFIIRAAVVGGVATATEVSTIGIVYSVLCGLLLYRRFDWRRLSPMLIETAALSGAILLIIGAATGMAWALTQSGFSTALARFMTNLPGGAPMFLAVTIVAFIVLGSVLEGVPAVVLFGPLLFPIARMMGVHEVHYAIIAVFAMGLGLFTPPFGVGFYLACAIGRASPDEVIRHVWPHLAALLVALLLIVFLPWISIGFL